ncbi:MAG: DUF1566 domain-containing protein [Candidatus Competibacteraceae bacterium]
MNDFWSSATPRRSLWAAWFVGVLAGLATLDVLAVPPTAPVPPLFTSAIRFTDHGNGTVTDSVTGLVWLKNANCFSTERPWSTALSLANGLASGSCGLTDSSVAGQWRLPTRNELQSLQDYTRSAPALPVDHPFTNVQSIVNNRYWSSTTDASDTSRAWFVNLYDGFVLPDDKASSHYVWPVRGGQ